MCIEIICKKNFKVSIHLSENLKMERFKSKQKFYALSHVRLVFLNQKFNNCQR